MNINIAMAFDEAYSIHGATAIKSLLANKKLDDTISIYILDTGLAGATREKLHSLIANLGTLNFIDIPIAFFNGFPTKFHPASTYARFALAETIPHLSRILYLDSDIIVLDSLRELYSHPMMNKPLAAAPDVISHFRGEAVPYMQALGVADDAKYFNAGVTLIDLEQWREQKLTEKLRTWISQHEHLMLHSDQSALNALMWNNYSELPLRWNLQVPLIRPVKYGWGCTTEQEEAVRNPSIIHFITEKKPWRQEYKVPYSEYYWNYRRKLGWNAKADKLTLLNLLNRLKEETVEMKHYLRTSIRKTLGRIPKPQ